MAELLKEEVKTFWADKRRWESWEMEGKMLCISITSRFTQKANSMELSPLLQERRELHFISSYRAECWERT